jgi:hypothetical protein
MNVDRFPVEAGHVLAFRRACGDPAAEAGADTAGQTLAPPTFVQAGAQFEVGYRLRPTSEPWWGSGSGPGRMLEGGGGLHAEQSYVYHRPVRVGDVLSAQERAGKTWEKTGRSGTLNFTETLTDYRDADGELVVTARSVSVRRTPAQETT